MIAHLSLSLFPAVVSLRHMQTQLEPAVLRKRGIWTEQDYLGHSGIQNLSAVRPSLCETTCHNGRNQSMAEIPRELWKQISRLHSCHAQTETFDVFFIPAGDSVEAYPGAGF